MSGRIETLADPSALAERVAAWLLELALAKAGRFALCLSGGSTPRLLYERLGEAPFHDSFPWDRTHLFWGDERFVPQDDKDSNYRMAREALLSHAPIPPSNIHPIPTEGLTPGDAARAYESTLRDFHADPLFDVVLLGLGDDGHTASLFPGTSALAERTRWALPVIGAKPEPRITLSYPALESSRAIAFLVAGTGKRDILARVIAGDTALPATRLAALPQACIFADRAANP